MKKKFLIIPTLLLLVVAGCKKGFLDTRPDGIVLEDQLREAFDVAPEIGAVISKGQISGIYTYMYSYNTALRASGRHDDFGQKSIDLSTDLTAEDMVQTAHHWFGFDYLVDDRQATFSRVFTNWNFYYRIIYSANQILAPIDLNTTDPALKSIAGQALALRGWSYLNLAQLFQVTYKGNEMAKGVPIYTSSSDLSSKGRGTLTDVYTQIEADLTKAIDLLAGWTRTSKEQVNQAAARGMLARAYLNMERWSDAATQAAAARQGLSLMSTAQYTAGFSDINNPEWMWGGDLNSNTSTIFASFFSHMDNTSPGYAGALGIYKAISRKLYDKIPATDVRKNNFNSPVTPSVPGLPAYVQLKFRDPGAWVGDYVYMRVAEMYLIEAEALAMSGQEVQARQVLFDLVSKRDAAYTLSTNSGDVLVDEIRTHRRIELWGEGFNLNDFRRWKIAVDRTGSNHRADAVLTLPVGDKRYYYQLPQSELDANINIPAADQNP